MYDNIMYIKSSHDQPKLHNTLSVMIYVVMVNHLYSGERWFLDCYTWTTPLYCTNTPQALHVLCNIRDKYYSSLTSSLIFQLGVCVKLVFSPVLLMLA